MTKKVALFNSSSKVTPGISVSVSSMSHDNGSFTLQQEVKSSACFINKLTTLLRAWISIFSFMFFILKYTVHEANYSLSKLVIFSIDYNTKVPQDGAGMYPGSDVTFIIQVMNSSMLYVKRSNVISYYFILKFSITAYLYGIWLYAFMTIVIKFLFPIYL